AGSGTGLVRTTMRTTDRLVGAASAVGEQATPAELQHAVAGRGAILDVDAMNARAEGPGDQALGRPALVSGPIDDEGPVDPDPYRARRDHADRVRAGRREAEVAGPARRERSLGVVQPVAARALRLPVEVEQRVAANEGRRLVEVAAVIDAAEAAEVGSAVDLGLCACSRLPGSFRLAGRRRRRGIRLGGIRPGGIRLRGSGPRRQRLRAGGLLR